MGLLGLLGVGAMDGRGLVSLLSTRCRGHGWREVMTNGFVLKVIVGAASMADWTWRGGGLALSVLSGTGFVLDE